MILPRVQKMGLFEGPQGEYQAELKRPAGLLVPGKQEVPLRAAPNGACVCQVLSVGLALKGKFLSPWGGGGVGAWGEGSEKTRWHPKPIQSTSADGAFGVGSFSLEA